jgi:hypothetical protein
VEVTIGTDTHKASLAPASVDALGRVVGVREFTNDHAGHRSVAPWGKAAGATPKERDRGVLELRGIGGPDPVGSRRRRAWRSPPCSPT